MKTNDRDELITVIDNSNYQGESDVLYQTYYGTYENIKDAVKSLLVNEKISINEFIKQNNDMTKNYKHLKVVDLYKTNKHWYEVICTENGVFFKRIEK